MTIKSKSNKEKPVLRHNLDHPALEKAVLELLNVKKAAAELKEREDELKTWVLEVVEEFGPGRFITPSVEFTVYESSSSRISRTELLEKGVAPGVVDDCTNVTGYRALRGIEKTSE